MCWLGWAAVFPGELCLIRRLLGTFERVVVRRHAVVGDAGNGCRVATGHVLIFVSAMGEISLFGVGDQSIIPGRVVPPLSSKDIWRVGRLDMGKTSSGILA